MELVPETPGVIPDSEVPAKATRRRFTNEYKLRILREVDRCKQPGEIGAILRREGLYSSLVSTWRQERDRGALRDLASRKRGRKADPDKALKKRVSELERENARLRKRLEQAETIISVQKKVAHLLGNPPQSDDESEGS
jgi:transposase-like protein